jgi:general secretion pathway protein D
LGSIPLLGWLFKDTADQERKTNMMVFLTPHVIRNPQEAKKLHHLKKKEIENPSYQKNAEEDQEEIKIDRSDGSLTPESGS